VGARPCAAGEDLDLGLSEALGGQGCQRHAPQDRRGLKILAFGGKWCGRWCTALKPRGWRRGWGAGGHRTMSR
jgi:hypothetical protein